MDYLGQVQRGIDYIEDHLDRDIRPADVAKVAGISQWHFQRIFKALTNETLKTYIRARRLANSLDALVETDRRIIEIAMDAGFESHEAFTRAFKKAFGLAPIDYRQRGNRFQFLRKVRIDADYLSHIHQNLSLEPELIRQPALAMVGIHTRFFSVDSEKNNIGDKLPPLWSEFVARMDAVEGRVPGMAYGVVSQHADQSEELDYYATVEVERSGSVPSGMVNLTVAEGRYAKFAHRGDPTTINATVNYIYSTWLAQSGMRHTYAPDMEYYGSEYVPGSADSVMYYAIPVA